jgi:hypothetical protein
MPPKVLTELALAVIARRRDSAAESAKVFFDGLWLDAMSSAQDRQYEQGGLPPMGAVVQRLALTVVSSRLLALPPLALDLLFHTAEQYGNAGLVQLGYSAGGFGLATIRRQAASPHWGVAPLFVLPTGKDW